MIFANWFFADEPDYFSIKWHTIDYNNVTTDLGWVHYCSLDEMSNVEIDNMAKELGLNEDFIVMWEHPDSNDVDGTRIIETDRHALDMCENVDATGIMNLYASVEKFGNMCVDEYVTPI